MTDTLSTIASSPIGWDATTPMGYAALLVLIAFATSWHMTYGGGK